MVALITFGASASVVSWLGCVGSDPASGSTSSQADPNAKDGDFRGKCIGDRCLSDLVCYEGVCLYADGGGPPTTSSSGTGSSGTGSSGTSSSGSSRTPCPISVGPAPAVACPGALDAGNVCGNLETCCVTSDHQECTTNAAQCTAGKPFRCSTNEACGGERCCLKDVTNLPNTCPVALTTADVSGTDCGPECGTNARRVCTSDMDCVAPARCSNANVTLPNLATIHLGLCL